MSKILALDTSTDACSVALWVDGEVREDFRLAPREHTRLLLPMAEALLAEAGLAPSQLDAVAFGRGPGSFTGIRIATGVAQGLAFAADLKVLPVSTLEAMALQQGREQQRDWIVAALDARMDEIYWCAYELICGVPNALVAEQVCAPDELFLPSLKPWLAAGPGFNYLDQMSASVQDGLQGASIIEVYPSAGAMLPLAERDLLAGRGLAPEEGLPVYLREGTWKKKDEQ
ncbi:tRNA (adenosine(37)-N6)-threonylcarbamoyltransferase complex dimerization subunit type 1 TsaB [Marinobacterium nitratireducens]|uniref:tRNA threonylcarbamoyladenosine biosynthesis protein TsaB n=1 Tax=Marinobacterium nitratireducens TaxID=518897 RepID=A0A917ZHK3_9GAMM|nr:tRNA (adenosine(37)-N6)-threonylcarbamoyltransferase complex dimerization subunit type 1 TsaB [Marinobacterium nitratireducens]GGO82164.1 tRNA (adenosine(37)-N6)-threonylcarbamoyltransferase complex dimerization subunit type 1 TsaB [Marinobacterium nitratireducens]